MQIAVRNTGAIRYSIPPISSSLLCENPNTIAMRYITNISKLKRDFCNLLSIRQWITPITDNTVKHNKGSPSRVRLQNHAVMATAKASSNIEKMRCFFAVFICFCSGMDFSVISFDIFSKIFLISASFCSSFSAQGKFFCKFSLCKKRSICGYFSMSH